MVEVTELKIEHVSLFVIAAFLLYHLMGRCGMRSIDGFRVGAQVNLCECSKSWIGRLRENGPIETHADICADGNPKIVGGRPRHFCTDQTDPKNCENAGKRDWVGRNTCKWIGPAQSCYKYNDQNWCNSMGCMWDGFTCKEKIPVTCIPNMTPPQICPGDTLCPANGICPTLPPGIN